MATLIAFYFPWLSGAKAFYLTDITNHFEPTMSILSEYWLKGQFQLWNPYAHCGQPQIAIPQPNLFYPPNWLFAWLPFSQAMAWNLVGHQLLLAVGNFMLVAGLGWGLVPALLAAIVAALSTYAFSLSTNYTLIASAAWLPLIIHCLRSFKSQWHRRYFYFLVGALATTLMILTGRPEIFAPGLFLIGVYILISCALDLKCARQLALSSFIWQILAISLGILMTAFFILPSMEWQALSPRAHGLVAKEVFTWSANWYDFMGMLIGQPLGDLYVQGGKFLHLVAARPGYPPYLMAFVGPVVIALAIVGIFNKGFRVGYMLAAMLLFFAALAAGDNLPLAPYLVTNFPKLAVFRFPVKLLFFPVWFLSILAARGLYIVLEKKSQRLPLLSNFFLWSVLALAAVAMPLYQQVFVLTNQTTSASVLEAQQLISQAVLTMASLGLVVSLVLWLRQNDKFGRLALSVIVVGSAFVLLMMQAYSYCRHGAAPDFFRQNPSFVQGQLAALGEDVNKLSRGVGGRIVTLYFAGLLMPNKLLAEGDPDWPASYYQYGRQILNPSTHFDQRLCSSFGYEGAETADYRTLFVDCFNKSHIGAGGKEKKANVDLPFYRFCQVTSTNYVFGMGDRLLRGTFVETAKLDPSCFELLEENRTWNLRIYKVKDPLPRVYMSYQWQNVTAAAAVKICTNASSVDFNPWKQTLVTFTADVLPPNGAGNWQAQFVENSANQVSIKVSTDKSGLMVLTDHYYPGWLATVDGIPTTIFRANGVLRAVYIQPGQHTVVFRYAPQSLKNGFIVAGMAFIALLILTGFLFIRGRRSS